MIVSGGILALVALIFTGTIFHHIHNNTAIISYEGIMKEVRTELYICESQNNPVLHSGSAGIAICDTEEKFPVLPRQCNDRAMVYQIKRIDGSWELTTVQASDPSQLWYCRGCNMLCTPDGCSYNELVKGACRQDR